MPEHPTEEQLAAAPVNFLKQEVCRLLAGLAALEAEATRVPWLLAEVRALQQERDTLGDAFDALGVEARQLAAQEALHRRVTCEALAQLQETKVRCEVLRTRVHDLSQALETALEWCGEFALAEPEAYRQFRALLGLEEE